MLAFSTLFLNSIAYFFPPEICQNGQKNGDQNIEEKPCFLK
jgi:hypothetical protein